MGGWLTAIHLSPLFVFLEQLDACIVVPAVAVATLIAYFGQVVSLDAVAVAEERPVGIEFVESCP